MDLQEQTDERCTLLNQTPPPCRSPPRIDLASGLSSLCARARLCPRMGRRLVRDRRWPSLPRLRTSMDPEGPPWQLPCHRTVEAARYGADDLSPRTVRAACAQPRARCTPHHARLLSLQRVPLPCMAIRSTGELTLDDVLGVPAIGTHRNSSMRSEEKCGETSSNVRVGGVICTLQLYRVSVHWPIGLLYR